MKLRSIFAVNLLDSKLRRVLAKESAKWNARGPWRIPSVCYTLEHKLAFLEREHYLTGHYSLRGLFHDWEKPFLYLCPWITDEKKIQELHRKFSPHHIGCAKTATPEHLIEMYIDWDCAAITKPDKPLNSFETLIHFYPFFIREMLPVCLVMNVYSVKSDVYIHPWHNLAKDVEYNQKIYSEVVQVLTSVIEGLPKTEADLQEIRKKYRQERKITNLLSAEIFVLVLETQQHYLNCCLKSWGEIKNILIQVLNDMQQSKSFSKSLLATVTHNYKKVYVSPFSV